MSAKSRQLNLNLFVYPGGHHEAGWRYKGSSPERILDIKYYQALAQRAEAAKFDALFFADGPALTENIRYVSRPKLEPLTWISAMAAVTERIGFIATASTTYNQPYNFARFFASIDHLSNGRAGWNIVTTGDAGAAQNFGLDAHPTHADRYDRAGEFVDVVTKLWDSWEDDALVGDRQSGIFADDGKIHAINHIGRYHRVRGPLTLPRSPQGRPVYVQAGSSEDGKSFASRYAEAIFTAHQTIGNAQEFYSDIKARVKAVGRNPDQVKVLPGISPFIGSTEAEAKALYDEFNELIQPEYSLDQLRRLLGIDLSGHDLDGPFPRELIRIEGEVGVSSRFHVVLDIVDREKPTIRQLLHRLAGARGHWVEKGTPEQIADKIQLWFENGAADGFNVMPPYLTGGFDIFVDEVVPILRKRGLFRLDYEGTTLREHFGLDRPESQYSLAQSAIA
ncbi:LLM class flavin-dependent oxidoreductase [Rhizobium binxianense]|uniref:LLM class flavin-dependent oxidoreductase n=1 Tax=Rhizobium binxianense TaxID=3024242 RepID=UPI00234ECE65|nr:LLM class flavin-dependent oxidoreductase [Rhizobium sp. BC56]MDC7746054.1 LLM class flavin-dependent oxidoreductase [Rhizobium sp. BC56]